MLYSVSTCPHEAINIYIYIEREREHAIVTPGQRGHDSTSACQQDYMLAHQQRQHVSMIAYLQVSVTEYTVQCRRGGAYYASMVL